MKADTSVKRQKTNERLAALREQCKTNPNDKQAMTALIAALNDSYPFARRSAAGNLGQLGVAAKEAVPALANCLKSSDPFLASQAASSLLAIGPEAKDAVPALLGALELGNCSTAWYSAKALGVIKNNGKVVIPALIKCLHVHDLDNLTGDPGPQLAFEAADALARFESEAQSAIPYLREQLNHPNSDFKLHLAVAIISIDPHNMESSQILVALMNENKMSSRTLTALANLGVKANSAIPAVEDYLKRELNAAERQHATFALRCLKGEAMTEN